MTLLNLPRVWKLFYGNNEISVLYNGDVKVWEKPTNDRLVLYSDSAYSGIAGFSSAEGVGIAKPNYTDANTWSITEIGTTTDTLVVKYENGGVPSQIPGIDYITMTLDTYLDGSNNLIDIILEWSGNTDIGYVASSPGIHTAIDSTNTVSQIATGLLGILPDYNGPFPCIGHVEFTGNGKIGTEHDAANLSVYFNETTAFYRWYVDGVEVANNTATYSPTESDDGGELDCLLTITNAEGTDAHFSIAPITVTYYAPVANGTPPDQTWIIDEANSINFANYISVSNDADLSGVSWSVNTGAISGMTINTTTGLFSGTPDTPQAETSLVIDAENSGGIFQLSANVTIESGNTMIAIPITVGNYGGVYYGYSTNSIYPENFGSIYQDQFESHTIEMLTVQTSGRFRMDFVEGQISGVTTIYAHIPGWGANNPVTLTYSSAGRYQSGLVTDLGTFFAGLDGSNVSIGLYL